MRHARTPRRREQNWATFARCLPSSFSICTLVKSSMWVSTHLHDLLPTPGPPVPLREATPYGQSPNSLMRGRDHTFGSCFARVVATSGITMLTTPYHAPRANAICERFLGSVRRACLDHLFILQEKQLHRVLHASVQYFNRARPHQGITQQIPERYGEPVPPDHDGGKILSFPVLVGLHHDYRRSARSLTGVRRSGWFPWVDRASSGKSHTVSPFLPVFSDECNKQEVFVFPCKNASRCEAKASA